MKIFSRGPCPRAFSGHNPAPGRRRLSWDRGPDCVVFLILYYMYFLRILSLSGKRMAAAHKPPRVSRENLPFSAARPARMRS